MAVTYTVPAYPGLHCGRQALDEGSRRVLLAVEGRKRAALACELDGSEIGDVAYLAHDFRSRGAGCLIFVAQPKHGERVGEPRDAESDAPGTMRLLTLAQQRKARDLDDVVEEAHGELGGFRDSPVIESRRGREWLEHEGGEVERAEVAGAEGRKGFLGARVGRAQGFTVTEVVLRVDAIDEEDPRFGAVVGAVTQPLPQIPRPQRTLDRARHRSRFTAPGPFNLRAALLIELLHREHQRPGGVIPDGVQEGIGNQHGDVEMLQAPRLPLG